MLTQTTRDGARLSAKELALWLAANWWRLRFEGPLPENAEFELAHEWKMSHNLASIGNGYVWPNIEITTDGEVVELTSKATRSNHGETITYLETGTFSVPVKAFEKSIDDFIKVVLERLEECGVYQSELLEFWDEIARERKDAALASARRLEAMLGFDPYEAPKDEIETLLSWASKYGEDGLDEIAYLYRRRSHAEMQALLKSLESDATPEVSLAGIPSLNGHPPSSGKLLPWEIGVEMAKQIRPKLVEGVEPLNNDRLSDILESDIVSHVTAGNAPRGNFAAAVQHNGSKHKVRFQSPHADNRRFELARVVGDVLISGHSEGMHVALHGYSNRQKVQRAFAAELLAPLDGLLQDLGTDGNPSEDAIFASAERYGVSDLVVRRKLNNHGYLDSRRVGVSL